jgi:DNA polymerase IV
LRQTIEEQALQLAQKLAREQVTGTIVRLKLRWSSFETITRQALLPRPTADARVIAAWAQRLLQQANRRGRPVRLIGVAVSGLGQHPIQLSLWDQPPEPAGR